MEGGNARGTLNVQRRTRCECRSKKVPKLPLPMAPLFPPQSDPIKGEGRLQWKKWIGLAGAKLTGSFGTTFKPALGRGTSEAIQVLSYGTFGGTKGRVTRHGAIVHPEFCIVFPRAKDESR